MESLLGHFVETILRVNLSEFFLLRTHCTCSLIFFPSYFCLYTIFPHSILDVFRVSSPVGIFLSVPTHVFCMNFHHDGCRGFFPILRRILPLLVPLSLPLLVLLEKSLNCNILWYGKTDRWSPSNFHAKCISMSVVCCGIIRFFVAWGLPVPSRKDFSTATALQQDILPQMARNRY